MSENKLNEKMTWIVLVGLLSVCLFSQAQRYFSRETPARPPAGRVRHSVYGHFAMEQRPCRAGIRRCDGSGGEVRSGDHGRQLGDRGVRADEQALGASDHFRDPVRQP